MIIGIGTDIAKINRFEKMSNFSKNRLLTFFSETELIASQNPLNQKTYLSEKLATRFAAKEALYKALSSSLNYLKINHCEFSLRFLAQQTSIESSPLGIPFFKINWHSIEQKLKITIPSIAVHLSISHEQEYALAFVICEQKNI